MTKNIAHRGFSGLYPENTMLAFEKAIEAGSDGIEFDVHFSKDGELVIIHDETLQRTTNGSGYVKDHTLAQLQLLDAAAHAGAECPQRIPTLREYFELVHSLPNFITNIELKTGVFEYEGIEAATLKIIDEFGLRENTLISSFNHFTNLRFAALAKDVKQGFLTESWVINMGAYTKSNNVECIHPIFYNLTPALFAEMKDCGREVNTWTVNEDEDIKKMLALGVDGIIGNFPDRVAQIQSGM